MTKNEIVNYFDKMDRGKFKTFQNGVAFDLVIRDLKTGDFLHTGIGSGLDMTLLSLYSLADLYKNCEPGTTVEAFAESIKNGIIESVKNNLFKSNDIE